MISPYESAFDTCFVQNIYYLEFKVNIAVELIIHPSKAFPPSVVRNRIGRVTVLLTKVTETEPQAEVAFEHKIAGVYFYKSFWKLRNDFIVIAIAYPVGTVLIVFILWFLECEQKVQVEILKRLRNDIGSPTKGSNIVKQRVESFLFAGISWIYNRLRSDIILFIDTSYFRYQTNELSVIPIHTPTVVQYALGSSMRSCKYILAISIFLVISIIPIATCPVVVSNITQETKLVRHFGYEVKIAYFIPVSKFLIYKSSVLNVLIGVRIADSTVVISFNTSTETNVKTIVQFDIIRSVESYFMVFGKSIASVRDA